MNKEFLEVRNTHTNEQGDISIDGYKTEDDNEEGVVIATVNLDGLVCYSSMNTQIDAVNSPLIQEAIKEAQETQKELKQLIIDKVIKSIQKDLEMGDSTAIDELLMFCPSKNLQAYL